MAAEEGERHMRTIVLAERDDSRSARWNDEGTGHPRETLLTPRSSSLHDDVGRCRWQTVLAAGLLGIVATISLHNSLPAPLRTLDSQLLGLDARREPIDTANLATDLIRALTGKLLTRRVIVRPMKTTTTTTTSPKIVRVACVGDSITFGAFASKNSKKYPAQLQRMLGPNYHIMNFGHCGACLLRIKPPGKRSRYWDTTEFNASLRSKPDIVVIMLGTNDAIKDTWPKYRANFVPDYIALICKYMHLSSRPTVMIAVPPPVLINLVWGGMLKDAINGDLPPLIHSVAITTRLPPAIPVFEAFEQYCGSNVSECPWITGDGDGCHPSDRGYLQMARMVRTAILASPPTTESPRGERGQHHCSVGQEYHV